MSDTTITPEEMEMWASTANRQNKRGYARKAVRNYRTRAACEIAESPRTSRGPRREGRGRERTAAGGYAQEFCEVRRFDDGRKTDEIERRAPNRQRG